MVGFPANVEAVYVPEVDEWHCGACEHNMFFDEEAPAVKACPDCGAMNDVQPYKPA